MIAIERLAMAIAPQIDGFVTFWPRRIIAAVRRGNKKALRQAGAYARKVARSSVMRADRPSAPGQPPHSRTGRLKRALLFGVEARRDAVLVGPATSIIGPTMAAHEFGGRSRKRRYPKRPLMGPTLERSQSYLPALWRDSIKE